ncbi:signal transduction histidine kinase [Spirochaeta africana DSM 8902]|uniref:histidine kinase n=2 Tax=Spirochaeta TaxID=146 RepID=H9UHP7_SPIAZ|nr:signal transduction histidine kinase [Spirochaeta africana DSM 8902]
MHTAVRRWIVQLRDRRFPRRPDTSRFHTPLLVLQLLGYAAAGAGFHMSLAQRETAAYYHETVMVYIIGIAAASLLLHLLHSPPAIRSLLAVKILFLILITYTVTDFLLIPLPLIMVQQAETSLLDRHLIGRTSLHLALLLGIVWIGLNSTLLGRNAFAPVGMDPIPALGTLLILILLVFLATAFQLLASYAYRYRHYYQLSRQQETSLDNLSEFNQRLQRWAQTADAQSAERERNRISRELHDISGYMFTNLIALMDAAISTGNRNPQQLTELLTNARKQAQEGLQETRIALRKQREVRHGSDSGLRTIHKITSIFQQVTGTTVELHFGNLPASFDTELNRSLYRIVQESLTNAIRHGKASQVSLHFWIHQDTLIINIHDNGIGSSEIHKGIGLIGMEERTRRLGGSIEAGNAPEGGFRLYICVPLVPHGSTYRARHTPEAEGDQPAPVTPPQEREART